MEMEKRGWDGDSSPIDISEQKWTSREKKATHVSHGTRDFRWKEQQQSHVRSWVLVGSEKRNGRKRLLNEIEWMDGRMGVKDWWREERSSTWWRKEERDDEEESRVESALLVCYFSTKISIKEISWSVFFIFLDTDSVFVYYIYTWTIKKGWIFGW